MSSHGTKPIRILLIDDHAAVRAGFRMLLEVHSRFEVIGEAGHSDEALALASQKQPDIILLDLDLGNKSKEDGFDLIPKLITSCPSARILVLTATTDEDAHQRAARLGAMGLVRKEDSAVLLVKAVERVHAGELWFDRSLLGSLLAEKSGAVRHNDPEAVKIASLTERERAIVPLVGEGLSNKQIAGRLNMGEKTVRNYLTEIFDKLDVASRFELIIYAYRHGLAKPPTLEKH